MKSLFRIGLGWLLPLVAVGSAAADEGEFTPPTINVPAGMVVELAAGPPLVEHPTFATFDDQGRLFVCENAGVNMSAEELEQHLPNSIRLLQDTNGDGKFDTSTMFADKMTFPMGGAWHDGALYVASPPNIWRLEDTDGDGIADKRDVLVSKFGYTGNAADIHGCVAGPDGRLYWCDGYHGHEFRDDSGDITSKREGSYLFSCEPDGTDVRIHCGGGMDNPVEIDFTSDGEMLGTVNILYTRPRVDCLVHWLYGGAYPHRERVLTELKTTGDWLGPVYRFGHVAVSGTQRYRSGRLDGQWKDNFFTTFFNSGKVVRVELERQGSTFRATQREFLSSPSRDFHPTDIAEDADGSLLVVDTGGWFYRGCPTSQFAKPDVRGAIYRVRRQDAVREADPRGNKIQWSELTGPQLVELFADPRYVVRQRALAACAARGESLVPVLADVMSKGTPEVRQVATWALTRLVGAHRRAREDNQEATNSSAAKVLRNALADEDAGVRLIACQALRSYPDRAAVEQLIALVKRDKSAPVRRAAATALGRIGDARAVESLLAALPTAVDRAQDHALIFALIEINDPAATRAGLAATSPDTQRGALIALDQMGGGKVTPEDLVLLVQSDDARLQRTAAAIFSRHPEGGPRAAEVIAGLLGRAESLERSAAALRQLMPRFLGEPAVGDLVGQRLNDAQLPPATRDLLLEIIASGQSVPLHESWAAPLRRWLSDDDIATVEKALAAVSAIATDQFAEPLAELGADEQRPVVLRVAAMEVASGSRGSLSDPALALLLDTVAEGSAAESLAAAQKIGSVSLSKPQLLQLAPQLTTATPAQLPELLRPFERSNDIDVSRALLDAMENARALTSLAPHQFSDVILRYPPELLPAANRLLDRVRQEEQQKLARLDSLLPLLKSGDVQRGRAIFFAEKSKCATCHRVGDQGERIGPDLTTIGANRTGRDLLESIVMPSATLVRDYEPYSLVTTDGRVLTGLIARETADTVYLQQQTGEPVAVPRESIEELTASTVSIMPNGLEMALTETELADVIAYLLSLKASGVASAP